MVKDIRVSFRLKAGKDDDLISWYESIGENDKSYQIRETLRSSLTLGIPHVSPSPVNNDSVRVSENINNKPIVKEKSIAEISEAELEKNLRGWLD